MSGRVCVSACILCPFSAPGEGRGGLREWDPCLQGGGLSLPEALSQ